MSRRLLAAAIAAACLTACGGTETEQAERAPAPEPAQTAVVGDRTRALVNQAFDEFFVIAAEYSGLLKQQLDDPASVDYSRMDELEIAQQELWCGLAGEVDIDDAAYFAVADMCDAAGAVATAGPLEGGDAAQRLLNASETLSDMVSRR